MEWIFERFEHPNFQIEVAQIIIHKADQPDIVVHFFDADGLAGKDLTEINFLAAPSPTKLFAEHGKTALR
jgi:hypothetical protein